VTLNSVQVLHLSQQEAKLSLWIADRTAILSSN